MSMNEQYSAVVAEAARDLIDRLRVDLACWSLPHVYMRPRVYQDGSAWCALYGDNLMEGVCGFGPTPQQACHDFDRAWCCGERKRQQGEA